MTTPKNDDLTAAPPQNQVSPPPPGDSVEGQPPSKVEELAQPSFFGSYGTSTVGSYAFGNLASEESRKSLEAGLKKRQEFQRGLLKSKYEELEKKAQDARVIEKMPELEGRPFYQTATPETQQAMRVKFEELYRARPLDNGVKRRLLRESQDYAFAETQRQQGVRINKDRHNLNKALADWAAGGDGEELKEIGFGAGYLSGMASYTAQAVLGDQELDTPSALRQITAPLVRALAGVDQTVVVDTAEGQKELASYSESSAMGMLDWIGRISVQTALATELNSKSLDEVLELQSEGFDAFQAVGDRYTDKNLDRLKDETESLTDLVTSTTASDPKALALAYSLAADIGSDVTGLGLTTVAQIGASLTRSNPAETLAAAANLEGDHSMLGAQLLENLKQIASNEVPTGTDLSDAKSKVPGNYLSALGFLEGMDPGALGDLTVGMAAAVLDIDVTTPLTLGTGNVIKGLRGARKMAIAVKAAKRSDAADAALEGLQKIDKGIDAADAAGDFEKVSELQGSLQAEFDKLGEAFDGGSPLSREAFAQDVKNFAAVPTTKSQKGKLLSDAQRFMTESDMGALDRPVAQIGKAFTKVDELDPKGLLPKAELQAYSGAVHEALAMGLMASELRLVVETARRADALGAKAVAPAVSENDVIRGFDRVRKLYAGTSSEQELRALAKSPEVGRELMKLQHFLRTEKNKAAVDQMLKGIKRAEETETLLIKKAKANYDSLERAARDLLEEGADPEELDTLLKILHPENRKGVHVSGYKEARKTWEVPMYNGVSAAGQRRLLKATIKALEMRAAQYRQVAEAHGGVNAVKSAVLSRVPTVFYQRKMAEYVKGMDLPPEAQSMLAEVQVNDALLRRAYGDSSSWFGSTAAKLLSGLGVKDAADVVNAVTEDTQEIFDMFRRRTAGNTQALVRTMQAADSLARSPLTMRKAEELAKEQFVRTYRSKLKDKDAANAEALKEFEQRKAQKGDEFIYDQIAIDAMEDVVAGRKPKVLSAETESFLGSSVLAHLYNETDLTPLQKAVRLIRNQAGNKQADNPIIPHVKSLVKAFAVSADPNKKALTEEELTGVVARVINDKRLGKAQSLQDMAEVIRRALYGELGKGAQYEPDMSRRAFNMAASEVMTIATLSDVNQAFFRKLDIGKLKPQAQVKVLEGINALSQDAFTDSPFDVLENSQKLASQLGSPLTKRDLDSTESMKRAFIGIANEKNPFIYPQRWMDEIGGNSDRMEKILLARQQGDKERLLGDPMGSLADIYMKFDRLFIGGILAGVIGPRSGYMGTTVIGSVLQQAISTGFVATLKANAKAAAATGASTLKYLTPESIQASLRNRSARAIGVSGGSAPTRAPSVLELSPDTEKFFNTTGIKKGEVLPGTKETYESLIKFAFDNGVYSTFQTSTGAFNSLIGRGVGKNTLLAQALKDLGPLAGSPKFEQVAMKLLNKFPVPVLDKRGARRYLDGLESMVQYNMEVANALEARQRVSMFITLLQDGQTKEAAARIVKRDLYEWDAVNSATGKGNLIAFLNAKRLMTLQTMEWVLRGPKAVAEDEWFYNLLSSAAIDNPMSRLVRYDRTVDSLAEGLAEEQEGDPLAGYMPKWWKDTDMATHIATFSMNNRETQALKGFESGGKQGAKVGIAHALHTPGGLTGFKLAYDLASLVTAGSGRELYQRSSDLIKDQLAPVGLGRTVANILHAPRSKYISRPDSKEYVMAEPLVSLGIAEKVYHEDAAAQIRLGGPAVSIQKQALTVAYDTLVGSVMAKLPKPVALVAGTYAQAQVTTESNRRYAETIVGQRLAADRLAESMVKKLRPDVTEGTPLYDKYIEEAKAYQRRELARAAQKDEYNKDVQQQMSKATRDVDQILQEYAQRTGRRTTEKQRRKLIEIRADSLARASMTPERRRQIKEVYSSVLEALSQETTASEQVWAELSKMAGYTEPMYGRTQSVSPQADAEYLYKPD